MASNEPVTLRKLVLKKHPEAQQADFSECFEIVEEKMDKVVEEGEIMLKVAYISVGPGCRNYINKGGSVGIGDAMAHWTAGKVIASKDDRFPVDSWVTGGKWPWQTYFKVKIPTTDPYQPITKVPKELEDDIPTWLALGANQGATSYMGILHCAEVKKGDTVVISAAAGATGSLAGQMAKVVGCGKLVGFCGSDDKCKYLTDDLGFDVAINYKTCDDLTKALKDACPDGIDVYFDNVGGKFLEAAIESINRKGRIAVCGQLGSYNGVQPGPTNLRRLIFTMAKIEGFNVMGFPEHWNKYLEDITEWIVDKKLKKAHITMIEGLENAPSALTRLFSGNKKGKVMVHIDDATE